MVGGAEKCFGVITVQGMVKIKGALTHPESTYRTRQEG